MTRIRLTVDGTAITADVDERALLVDVLREHATIAPKIGCLTGDCGACSVRVDDRLTKSCLKLGLAADGAEVTTIESLDDDGRLSPLQQAFWDENAFQCGFCVSGMLLAADDLLRREPSPDEEQVRTALSANLCRCTGYDAIVRAVLRCADTPAETRVEGGPADPT